MSGWVQHGPAFRRELAVPGHVAVMNETAEPPRLGDPPWAWAVLCGRWDPERDGWGEVRGVAGAGVGPDRASAEAQIDEWETEHRPPVA